jgi:tRNA uridine 5-carbamoylmethylation protein Kti12
METTLIIFSGLPGTGKTTLPRKPGQALPVDAIEPVAANLRRIVQYVEAGE